MSQVSDNAAESRMAGRPAQRDAARTGNTAEFRQLRYAVVLNGGVSLAVWMGGVTHELNRMRLASMPSASDGTLDAWRDILAAAGRTAVVDLIAGTSAGGLNGTVLATSIARGADMPDMRSVWSETAALSVGRLVRQDPNNAQSVLDGEYFGSQVKSLLASMERRGEREQDCTLLVTATALDSTVVPTPLESGLPMCSRDGRRVYRFRRALPRQMSSGAHEDINDFGCVSDTEGLDALSLAARASASFPVAFTPVFESNALAAQRDVPTDKRVGTSWLVDGGILDNAPIEPLLRALRDRPTDEPYDRVLLYITPGVGLSAGAVSSAVTTPSIQQTLTSVLSASREPDERMDSDSLRAIFDEMSYTRNQSDDMILSFLRTPSAEGLEKLRQAALLMFEHYRSARAEAFERGLLRKSGLLQTSPLKPPLSPTLTPVNVPGMPEVVFPAISEDSWNWGSAAADRCVRWWGRVLSARHKGADIDQAKRIAEAMPALAAAQQEITRLGTAINAAISGTPTNVLPMAVQLRNLADLYGNGSEALTAIYGEDPGSLSRVLAVVMRSAADAVSNAIGNITPDDLFDLSIAAEVLTGWRAWGGADYDVPEFRFHNVTPAAKPPACIPLQNLPNQPDWPIKKLYGQRLGHFGAFASEEGRNSDWLWGRLDGASELGRQILDNAGVATAEAERLVNSLITQILREEGSDPGQVVIEANRAHEIDNVDLLQQIRDDSDSVAALEATLWNISKQFGKVGFWLRVLLQPDWSDSQVADLLPPEDKRSEKLRRKARRYRRIAGIALWAFRKSLPRELQYGARRK